MNWTPPAPTAVRAPLVSPIRDIHSCANVNEIKPVHMHLDWTIDWDTWKSMSALNGEPKSVVSATAVPPGPAGGRGN